MSNVTHWPLRFAQGDSLAELQRHYKPVTSRPGTLAA
jgi:hypothetical protein